MSATLRNRLRKKNRALTQNVLQIRQLEKVNETFSLTQNVLQIRQLEKVNETFSHNLRFTLVYFTQETSFVHHQVTKTRKRFHL